MQAFVLLQVVQRVGQAVHRRAIPTTKKPSRQAQSACERRFVFSLQMLQMEADWQTLQKVVHCVQAPAVGPK